jgi:hypothetical protein
MKSPFLLICLLALAPSLLIADGSLDYTAVNKVLKQFDAYKVDGMECVPHYIKPADAEKSLDISKGDYRLTNDNGDVMRLKIEELAKIPEGDRSEVDKKMIDDGYLYRLWIPKDQAKFLPGRLRHSLPQQSMKMVPGSGIIEKSVKIKL